MTAYRLEQMNRLLDFVEFGLDRIIHPWVPMSRSRGILHVGPGNKHVEGTLELEWPEWDAETDPLPYQDEELGGIIATHFLEHLADPRFFLREAARVLYGGCPLNILVPHAQSLMAMQDLDHKSRYVLETWRVLLSNPYYTKDNNTLFPFRVGSNFVFGLKEDNLCLVTQLVKL